MDMMSECCRTGMVRFFGVVVGQGFEIGILHLLRMPTHIVHWRWHPALITIGRVAVTMQFDQCRIRDGTGAKDRCLGQLSYW
jgi:hypothetical protein